MINLLYVPFVGIWICMIAVAVGLMLCVTIIGIPAGLTVMALGFKALTYKPRPRVVVRG